MRVGPNAQFWPPKKRTHAFDGEAWAVLDGLDHPDLSDLSLFSDDDDDDIDA